MSAVLERRYKYTEKRGAFRNFVIMRSKTLIASCILSPAGTIRGGSFLSGLAWRDALLFHVCAASAIPIAAPLNLI